MQHLDVYTFEAGHQKCRFKIIHLRYQKASRKKKNINTNCPILYYKESQYFSPVEYLENDDTDRNDRHVESVFKDEVESSIDGLEKYLILFLFH